MRKVTLGGQEWPALFTTWSANEFYRLSGINLYEPGQLRSVFKTTDDEKRIVPAAFETVAKFAYCALAAGCMPDDAPEDWVPPFTWKGIMNKFQINEEKVFAQLVAVYYNQDLDLALEKVSEEVEKNQLAPQESGQS